MIEIIDPKNVINMADVIDYANGIPQETARFRETLINVAPIVIKFGAKV